ncbi:SO2930 family diheme c-type cytochrome [Sneathiella glossodoripedis]|uniref:SO2930 family diheme c-type cytochrome n=1 Tax=Sneathiella glossodoripedis TaxID=418853 RepID=UPI00046F7959|nr:SO2930 family diheme c-type cytochrome [Sneathiella glossodoripedis]
MKRFVLLVVSAVLLVGGGDVSASAVNDQKLMAKKPAKLLSAYGLFKDKSARNPGPALLRYELNNPLFTDYAEKIRYIYIPQSAGPAKLTTHDEPLSFPVGSVLVKTFAYPVSFQQKNSSLRFIETRLLIHKSDGWVAYPYVWNEEQNEAKLKVAGKRLQIPVIWEDRASQIIEYAVPNMNQCKGCHASRDKQITPIGPKIRNLNRLDAAGIENQINILKRKGYLSVQFPEIENLPKVPDPFDERAGSLRERARSYLDGNCAHCHAPGKPADTSGLYLNYEEERDVHWGIDKPPVAAGRGAGGLKVAIKPGQPDQSILYYRMNSVDPGIMMPELGRSLIHQEGLKLIEEFIKSLD